MPGSCLTVIARCSWLIWTGRSVRRSQRVVMKQRPTKPSTVFYCANVVYDMVRQWMVADGPFNYDYSWLTQKYTAQTIKPWADAHFKSVFGVSPDAFHCGG